MSSFRDVVIAQKREWQALLDQSYVQRDQSEAVKMTRK
jgi:hypothetical protein